MRESLSFITPSWPVPENVKCLSTTRMDGVSIAPYSSLNLGVHVGDELGDVRQNRALLREYLPAEPLWLNQVHGTDVAQALRYQGVCDADASVANGIHQVCTVMTADCLPVLFCDTSGTQVAAAHAGWRGLLDGVLENTVSKFEQPNQVLAWLGPAIGPNAFEVGQEVKDSFSLKDPAAERCFKPSQATGKWLADLYSLAKLHLNAVGVTQVFGGEHCTYSDEARFFSYRRDGVTGRMASCIWLTD